MTPTRKSLLLWRAFVYSTLLGSAWFGWTSFQWLTKSPESRDEPILYLGEIPRLIGSLLGLGITILLVVTVLIALLVDWRSEWGDGNHVRFGMAMSMSCVPIFALLGCFNLAAFLVAAALAGLLLVCFRTKSKALFDQPSPPVDAAVGIRGK